MNVQYLVSIIMPAYNSSKFIEESIESVLSQTYSNWELLVIDDCSTDDTSFLVNQYKKKDSRVKYFKMDVNSGSPAGPRNRGLFEAKGDFLAFLDSDDLWTDEKLERQINFMVENNYMFTCTDYHIISDNGVKISSYSADKFCDYTMMLKNNSVGCLTAMIKSSLIKGQYFPACGHEDYAMWLKLVKITGGIYALNEKLAYYRKANNSVSSNKVKVFKFFWHIYRYEECLSLPRTVYLCFRYFVNALFFKYA